jgi:hypothetical protein
VGPRVEVEEAEEARQQSEEAELARSRVEVAATVAEIEAEARSKERDEARRTVLTFVEAYVDLAGPDVELPKPYEFGCGTMFLAAIPSAAATVFGTGALLQASELLRTFGPVAMLLVGGGLFIASFAVASVVLSLTFSHMNEAGRASTSADAVAAWNRAHPELSKFRAMDLEADALEDPGTFAFVKGLAQAGLRAAGREEIVLLDTDGVRDAMHVAERFVSAPATSGYRHVG